MRYASIRSMDVSNGEGIGIALFVQGCHFHCHNCFNTITWNFDGGKEWTKEVENKFIQLAERTFITRVSFLGGEPLEECNLVDLERIVMQLDDSKKIWIYTGYTFENLTEKQMNLVKICDYLVDGQFMDDKKNPNLKFRGSSNQRIIDIKKTISERRIIDVSK